MIYKIEYDFRKHPLRKYIEFLPVNQLFQFRNPNPRNGRLDDFRYELIKNGMFEPIEIVVSQSYQIKLATGNHKIVQLHEGLAYFIPAVLWVLSDNNIDGHWLGNGKHRFCGKKFIKPGSLNKHCLRRPSNVLTIQNYKRPLNGKIFF